jgi:predicted nucleic acid-binding protein
MVKIYTDTSLFFSLYVTDANSPKADAWRQANPIPLEFTGFHRIELRNALGLAMFQQRLTPAESLAAWQEVEQDLASGLLVAKPNLWGKLLQEAESLAQHHTPTIGTRTLDVLHVASALVSGATEFCTLDTRQGRLAQLAGMHVQP